MTNQLILGFRDQNSGGVFCDFAFTHCRFEHCVFGTLRNVTCRPTARRITISDCTLMRCVLRGPILEDINVNGLRSESNLILWAPALRHVTLTGPMCNLIINRNEDPAGEADPVNSEFRLANARFYETTDWALDISEALFSSVSIRGVPSRLVRRDPESQVIIRRERVLDGRWRNLPLAGTHWATAIEWFIDRGEPDHVLVAPKRSPNFGGLVGGLRLLQKEGVADPD